VYKRQPYVCGLGKEVPAAPELWQDPIPEVNHPLVNDSDVAKLKSAILSSDLSVSAMVAVAFASASSFRGSDRRGGANGARIRLNPARNWPVNSPTRLGKVLTMLEDIQSDFIASASGGKQVSMADLIVLAGSAAIEKAAKDAGHSVSVPFAPGRMDATESQTDPLSYSYLEPKACGFRNFYTDGLARTPAELLVDRAQLLTLTGPEMTVLVGGLRVLGANAPGDHNGVFTQNRGQLSNDFFTNLLDMGTQWKATSKNSYEGVDRKTGAVKWTGTSVDLLFGSNSVLRALSEVYGSSDGNDKFIKDFIAAWTKVMNLDRFDLA